MQHFERLVFHMVRKCVAGWPELFSLNGTPDRNMLATKFSFRTPGPGFFKIHRCVTTRHEKIEFSDPDVSYIPYFELPGEPFDPGTLPRPAAITPLSIGPDYCAASVSDVRMRIEYSGKVPAGMQSGDTLDVIIMFIGARE